MIDRNNNVCVPSWVASKILHIESSLNKYVNAFDEFKSYEDEDGADDDKNSSKYTTTNKEDDIF